MTSKAYFNGDWYEAIELTSPGESPSQYPAKWRKIEIPDRFRPFIVSQAKSILLGADGQNEKQVVEERRAAGILMRLAHVHGQSDHHPADFRAEVSTR